MYISGLSIMFLYSTVNGCIDISVFQKDVYYFDPDDIILINNDDNQLINAVKNTFDSVQTTPDICPGGVRGLIEASKLFPEKYIINLNVPDFYKFNYNYVSQYLIYGGNRNVSEHEVKACTVDFKRNDLVNISCNEKSAETFTYPNVKLMSRYVENHTTLYNFVKNYPTGEYKTTRINTSSGMVILVCDDTDNTRTGYIVDSTKIDIKYSSNCEKEVMKYQNNLLAILASKPFEANNILAPIVLYQNLCYNEHIAQLDYYVTLTTCDGYKYGLLEFLKHSNWLRVAIVSDNTKYSEELEQGMTELFEKNGLTYTIVRCVETAKSECSFVQALQLLKKSDARVFIANIDKMNAEILQKDVSHVWSRGNKMSSWILRNFVLNGNTEKMGDIYAVSFELSIEDGIHNILYAYQEATKTDSHMGKSFYRQLAQKLQKWNTHSASVAVRKFQNPNYFKIMTLVVNDCEVKIEHSQKYYPRVDMDSCSVRTRNFQQPCDDNNLLLILVILVVVAACVLVSVIITNKLDVGRRYTNLS